MSSIFNLFGDSTEVLKAAKFAPAGPNGNPASKLTNIGAPGVTPDKIYGLIGSKSKGLRVRSTSDLNIRSSAPQFDTKKNIPLAEKSLLKLVDIFGKSTSPNKQKASKKLAENTSIIQPSPNGKEQRNDKSKEIVFKKPKTPRKSKKMHMDYPEPEILAPICDIDIDLFDLTHQNFLKLFNNEYFLVDEDEGFLSDTEPVPISAEKIPDCGNVSDDIDVPLPTIEPLHDFEFSFE